ncbi:MAG: hypothetical protein SPK15_04985 [Candidatus Onthomorpha sp.]|nr:hypothetical protein [Candidatus Onthomorpha sp.]
MAKFRLEFSALSIAKLKQNKPPFRSTKAAFCKNETAFGECPNAVLVLRVFSCIYSEKETPAFSLPSVSQRGQINQLLYD